MPCAGGKLVIINLQATPKDKKASLVIRARTDDVMRAVMAGLGMAVPAYVRQDAVAVVLTQQPPSSKGHAWALHISSVHGAKCALPLVQSVDVSFPVRDPHGHKYQHRQCTPCYVYRVRETCADIKQG
jgi:mono-ADP-ribosyltransferase sirtuin 6